MAIGLSACSALASPTVERRDTSRHWIGCMCVFCEANGTGEIAQREVLRAHRTKVLTPALYALCVALCVKRGRSQGDRHVG